MSGRFPAWRHRPLAGQSTTNPSRSGRSIDDPANCPTAANHTDPAAAYLAGLGEGSRRTMREALTRLAEWASGGATDPHAFDWHELGLEQTAALRTRLSQTFAPATANKHLAALRGVLKRCWQSGAMTTDAYRCATELPPVRGGSPRKTRRFGARELVHLVASCRRDPTAAGARDEAIFALLAAAGLRRSEAVALDAHDYDPACGSIEIRERRAPSARRIVLTQAARDALDRWLERRGDGEGPLFHPVNKGGRIEPRRLSEQAIYIACRKRAAEARLPPMSPEDLRRAGPAANGASDVPRPSPPGP